MGQETPKAELFGGYSYAGGGSNGFDASIAVNVNNWLGLVGDVGGQYSTFTDQGFTEKIRSHSFLVGPRFSARQKRVVPFVHALFGVSKLRLRRMSSGATGLILRHELCHGIRRRAGCEGQRAASDSNSPDRLFANQLFSARLKTKVAGRNRVAIRQEVVRASLPISFQDYSRSLRRYDRSPLNHFEV